ncbi:MAG: IF-2 protein [Myxococcaceae bacterium]|nr:IF-2 protein [Myxococcaceae bacterium]
MTERTFGQRVWIGFTRLVSTAFVVGLAGLVAYLASERNARTYSVQVDHGELVIHKGKNWPWGSEPWKPGDPALADAYAPVPLKGLPVEAGLQKQTFGDRDELDRALFGILERLARPRIASDDPKEVEEGVYYVQRMQKLSGLTADQRAAVEKLQAEFAWYLARYKLDQARRMVGDALHQLDLAPSGRSKNAQKANQLAAELAGPARQFEETLRRALGEMPAPVKKPEPAPEPAPTPPTATPAAPPPSAPAPTEATPAPTGAATPAAPLVPAPAESTDGT